MLYPKEGLLSNFGALKKVFVVRRYTWTISGFKRPMTMPSDFRDSRLLSEICDLIARLVRDVVDKPEAVTLDLIERENSAVLQLKVAEADLDRIIGPQKRTAKALRAI